ncbi:MAG: hypothetical protein ACRD50_03990 [Candidatus Acidiferrales bacterium]
MKISNILALTLAACAVVSAAPVRAQETVAAPIVAKILRTKPKFAHFKGQVQFVDSLKMIVSDRNDNRFVRTFSYSPILQKKVDAILQRGGWQYGDRVDVEFETESSGDVAVAIHGKPSKPR